MTKMHIYQIHYVRSLMSKRRFQGGWHSYCSCAVVRSERADAEVDEDKNIENVGAETGTQQRDEPKGVKFVNEFH
jgi:hypothetical protein